MLQPGDVLIALQLETFKVAAAEMCNAWNFQVKKIYFLARSKKFKMEVWSRGMSSLPNITDNLPGIDLRASTKSRGDAREVTVTRSVATRMNDFDKFAISGTPATVRDLAASDGDHRGAVGRRVVDRLMGPYDTKNWVPSGDGVARGNSRVA